MLKRAVTVLLSAVMLVSAGGCGKSVEITTGFDENTIFKVSDNEVSYNEVVLLLLNEKNKYVSDFGEGIWDKQVENSTIEERVKETVKDRVIYLEAMYMMSQDKGMEVSEEEKEMLKEASNKYCETLTEEEKSKLGIDKDCVYNIYKKNYLAKKVYDELTKDVKTEVSDEEARMMEVMYIYITKTDDNSALIKINEAYTKVHAGADFLTVAKQYTQDGVINLEISRGDMVEEVENKAFSLETGQYSDIIETERGYYIVKCVNAYLETKTQSNKENILKNLKNEAFLSEFEPFLEKIKLDINEKKWKEINMSDYKDISTKTIMDVYNTSINTK